MFDLNLNFIHDETITTNYRNEVEESGTSNSSIMNAEGCSSSNVGDDDSVSGSGAGDGDNYLQCFNFDILKVGESIDDRQSLNQYQTQIQSEFVTRALFPSHVNSLLLFPDSNNSNANRSEEMNVQQSKQVVQQSQGVKKSRRGPRSRSSQYRGVTFYRRTGRWESHIWDCGKQVYLGGFDTAHAAARAYDRAALKFRGVDADINFNISDYDDDMNQVKNLSKEDFVQVLRRHSSGFSRGGSKYRGNSGVWEAAQAARTGQLVGNRAYGNAALKSNGREMVMKIEANEGASHCGNGHSLDLNLRISTPSCLGSMHRDNMDHMQMNHGFHDLRNLQVRTTNSQYIGGSSHGPSNWAWQSYGQSQIPTAIFTAASSGFPTPAAPNYLNYS